jgi:DNA-binding CsgD family transcriptional regulator
MSDYCNTCPARSSCQSICPELSLHLKQIEKPQRELLISVIRFGSFPMPKKRITLTKREKQIVTLFADGKEYVEIAQVLNITEVNARNVLARIKKKRR